MKWSEQIISKQCKSTQALMHAQNLRKEEDDIEYISLIRFTPVAKEAQCVKEDGTVDLNVRPLSQDEADKHNLFRRQRGRIIEEIRGDKPVYTLTEEKRERAANAFMERFTLDAIKDKFKSMMRGLFKPSYAEIMAEEMRKRMKE